MADNHDLSGAGFVTRLGGGASREVIERALAALEWLSHRDGLDADALSGDGAAVCVPIPKDFSRKCAAGTDATLPERFGLGIVFLPREQAAASRKAVKEATCSTGLRILARRAVPTNASVPTRCPGFGNASLSAPSHGFAYSADSIRPCDRGERDMA